MIQVFGTKKCRDTQKVLRFFKERNIEIQLRDLDLKPPSPGELDDMAAALGGHGNLIDAEGPAAGKRGLAHMTYDAREELLEYPALYKTPLIRPGKGQALRGYDEKALKNLIKVLGNH